MSSPTLKQAALSDAEISNILAFSHPGSWSSLARSSKRINSIMLYGCRNTTTVFMYPYFFFLQNQIPMLNARQFQKITNILAHLLKMPFTLSDVFTSPARLTKDLRTLDPILQVIRFVKNEFGLQDGKGVAVQAILKLMAFIPFDVNFVTSKLYMLPDIENRGLVASRILQSSQAEIAKMKLSEVLENRFAMNGNREQTLAQTLSSKAKEFLVKVIEPTLTTNEMELLDEEMIDLKRDEKKAVPKKIAKCKEDSSEDSEEEAPKKSKKNEDKKEKRVIKKTSKRDEESDMLAVYALPQLLACLSPDDMSSGWIKAVADSFQYFFGKSVAVKSNVDSHDVLVGSETANEKQSKSKQNIYSFYANEERKLSIFQEEYDQYFDEALEEAVRLMLILARKETRHVVDAINSLSKVFEPLVVTRYGMQRGLSFMEKLYKKFLMIAKPLSAEVYPSWFINNKRIMCSLIEIDTQFFRVVGDQLKQDPQVVELAFLGRVQSHSSSAAKASGSASTDGFIDSSKYAAQPNEQLEYLPPKFKEDLSFMVKIIKNAPDLYTFLPSVLKNDVSVIELCIEHITDIMNDEEFNISSILNRRDLLEKCLDAQQSKISSQMATEIVEKYGGDRAMFYKLLKVHAALLLEDSIREKHIATSASPYEFYEECIKANPKIIKILSANKTKLNIDIEDFPAATQESLLQHILLQPAESAVKFIALFPVKFLLPRAHYIVPLVEGSPKLFNKLPKPLQYDRGLIRAFVAKSNSSSEINAQLQNMDPLDTLNLIDQYPDALHVVERYRSAPTFMKVMVHYLKYRSLEHLSSDITSTDQNLIPDYIKTLPAYQEQIKKHTGKEYKKKETPSVYYLYSLKVFDEEAEKLLKKIEARTQPVTFSAEKTKKKIEYSDEEEDDSSEDNSSDDD